VRTALTGDIPLMSREAEMGRILESLKGPRPAAFVLAGAAGVGKTRLAAEVARLVAGQGFATVQTVASRNATPIPFGPFARYLPEAGRAPGDLLGLLHQAGQAIIARAGPNGKLLLVVDDAQFLDEGSASLVHQLTHGRACSVLATVRTPGPAPDPVIALWKDGLADRIELAAWGEAQTKAAVEGFLGGQVAGSAARRLWEVSQGNALYLRELLIGAIGSGALTESDGIWTLRRPLSAPDRLVELVAARLALLASETVAVIETLAAGEPLAVLVLEQITSQAGLDDAETQGLVRIEQDGRRTIARLAHPVYGEVLRQALPRSRLRRISAMLAQAVDAAGARRREDLLRLGRWQLDSGQPGEPSPLSRAARRAIEVFDLELAGRLAQAALDAGGGAEAGLVLGEGKFRSGLHAEAESVLADTVARCRSDSERARVANARAYNLYYSLRDPAAAAAVLDHALAVVIDRKPRLQLLAGRALTKLFDLDLEGALADARPVLEGDDGVAVTSAYFTASHALALLGRCDEAVAVAYAGLEAHRRATGSPQLPEFQLDGAVCGHIGAGRLSEAEEDATKGHRACLAAGDYDGAATHLLQIARSAIEQGRVARARTAFLDAASVKRQNNDLIELRWCLAGLALAEAMTGHAEAALAAAAERDALPATNTMLVYEAELIERSRAWVSVATGERSKATEILAAAADRAAAVSMRVAEARLRHDIARLGQPGLVAARLAELAEVVEGQFVPAMAAHAAAMVSGKAAGIEAAGRAFEALGASLLAAEAYLAAAASYRSAGYARPTNAMTRRAAELIALCGDVKTPGLSAGTVADTLTRRELEVATMAAAGAASRDIAARLVLSVRTVDNHLRSAYLKLGVTSREELGQALRS